MKKIFLLFAVIASSQLFGQKITKPTSKSNEVNFTSELNTTFSVDQAQNSIFEYNENEVIVLLTEYTKKLKNKILVMYVFPYETGTQYVRYNKVTKKITRPEIIKTPFRGDESQLLTSLHRGDTLLLLHRYNNRKLRKDFVFATYHNLVSKKSKTIKVAEAVQKESVNVYSTQSGKYVITSEVKGASYKISYAIYDFTSELISSEIDMVIPKVNKSDDVDLSLTESGNIIANVVRPIEGSGGLFRARKYENLLYLIKNRSAMKIDVEKLQTHSRLVLIKDRKEKYRVVCISIDKGKSGITIGTLDEDKEEIVDEHFSEITGFDFDNVPEVASSDNSKKNSRKEARQERRKKAELYSMNHLSTVRFTEDNTMVVLLEHFYITVHTTTTTSRTGTTTRSTTYYNYGPGILCSFDEQNNLQKHNELQYAKRFANYNPGIGLSFQVGNNDRLIVSEFGDYYKTKITNDKEVLYKKLGEKNVIGNSFSSGMKLMARAYSGQLASISVFENTIYQVNNHRRKSLDLTTYSME